MLRPIQRRQPAYFLFTFEHIWHERKYAWNLGRNLLCFYPVLAGQIPACNTEKEKFKWQLNSPILAPQSKSRRKECRMFSNLHCLSCNHGVIIIKPISILSFTWMEVFSIFFCKTSVCYKESWKYVQSS